MNIYIVLTHGISKLLNFFIFIIDSSAYLVIFHSGAKCYVEQRPMIEKSTLFGNKSLLAKFLCQSHPIYHLQFEPASLAPKVTFQSFFCNRNSATWHAGHLERSNISFGRLKEHKSDVAEFYVCTLNSRYNFILLFWTAQLNANVFLVKILIF